MAQTQALKKLSTRKLAHAQTNALQGYVVSKLLKYSVLLAHYPYLSKLYMNLLALVPTTKSTLQLHHINTKGS